MLRLTVIVLLAFNLLLAGAWMARHDTRAEKSEPVAATPVSDLPTVVLMSEMEPLDEPLSAAFQCFALGPFETQESLRTVRARLEPHVVSITERTTEALMELGYWVELREFDEFGNAAGAVQALRQKGLDDVAVVTNESGERRVSLGYFLEERNARRRRDRARELGFAAATRVNREAQPRYWLDYLQTGDAPPAATALAEIVPPELHRSLPCPAPAAGD